MSTLRNAAPRRPHKERSQPQVRQKWGILEKHKDYSLRAKDYNLKKAKLSQLSERARERNPDEFAFGMLSAEKGRQGQHGRGTEENRLSHDAVKLLKSQDAGYLRTVAGRGRREVERLEEAVGLAGIMKEGAVKGRGRKIVFIEGEMPRIKKRKVGGEVFQEILVADVDGEVGQGISTPDGTEDAEDMVEDAVKPKLKSKKALEKDRHAKVDIRAARKRRQRLGELRVAKLEALKRRQRDIMAAANELDAQRSKMSRTIGGVNKNGVHFKIRERKK